MDEIDDVFAARLAAERVRNAQAINVVRLLALTAALGALGLFSGTIPEWIAAPARGVVAAGAGDV
jgi:hypothetical protein